MTIYCDAGFFDIDNRAIIGIVHKNRIWRVNARAPNGTAAELLAILLARKLCGHGDIVSDAQVVVRMLESRALFFNLARSTEVRHEDLFAVFQKGNVSWAKRRSNPELRIADSMTRKILPDRFRKDLMFQGFRIHDLVSA